MKTSGEEDTRIRSRVLSRLVPSLYSLDLNMDDFFSQPAKLGKDTFPSVEAMLNVDLDTYDALVAPLARFSRPSITEDGVVPQFKAAPVQQQPASRRLTSFDLLVAPASFVMPVEETFAMAPPTLPGGSALPLASNVPVAPATTTTTVEPLSASLFIAQHGLELPAPIATFTPPPASTPRVRMGPVGGVKSHSSRKAFADIRPRIKGRFARKEEADQFVEVARREAEEAAQREIAAAAMAAASAGREEDQMVPSLF